MSEEKRVVVRRSPAEWQAIMSRFERSGQSHREFCQAEDLAPSTFSWWRRKLGRSGSNGATIDAALCFELRRILLPFRHANGLLCRLATP